MHAARRGNIDIRLLVHEQFVDAEIEMKNVFDEGEHADERGQQREPGRRGMPEFKSEQHQAQHKHGQR